MSPLSASLFRGVAFFMSWANGNSPTDRLCTAAEGRPWRRDMWAAEVRSAIVVCRPLYSVSPVADVPSGPRELLTVD